MSSLPVPAHLGSFVYGYGVLVAGPVPPAETSLGTRRPVWRKSHVFSVRLDLLAVVRQTLAKTLSRGVVLLVSQEA